MNTKPSHTRYVHLAAFSVIALFVTGVVHRLLIWQEREFLRRDTPIPVTQSIRDLIQTQSNPIVPDEDRLTVEETVALAIGTEGSSSYFLNHANPKAIPELWSLIEIDDDGIWAIHSEVYCIFGYVGNDADAARMVEKLRSYRGVLNPAGRLLVPRIISALGRMAFRGVQTAATNLEEMSNVNYWKGRFQYVPEELRGPQLLPPELETVRSIVVAQPRRTEEEWRLNVQRLLSQIENTKDRQMVASRLQLSAPSLSFALADRVLEARKRPTEKQRLVLQNTYERRESIIKSLSKAQRDVWDITVESDWLRPRPLPKYRPLPK